MRNDLPRALGLKPETAQGLEMLDRPRRSLRRCRAPETIAPPAPPEQGARRAEDFAKSVGLDNHKVTVSPE
jgi:hypothetical protein